LDFEMGKVIDNFIHHLEAAGHFEGMMLYIFGAIPITFIHIRFAKEWSAGLRGTNGLWDAPEICIYIFTYVFPHMIMADQFIGLKASEMAWYFMIGLLAFALTGRFGLEWILALKNGSSKVTTIENETTLKSTTEIKESNKKDESKID